MEILHFFKKHQDYITKPITLEQVNDIIYYSDKGWYLQLLKEHGIAICLILLEYFIKEEDYMKCDKIVKSIEDSNKYFGTNHPINIRDYGNVSELL